MTALVHCQCGRGQYGRASIAQRTSSPRPFRHPRAPFVISAKAGIQSFSCRLVPDDPFAFRVSGGFPPAREWRVGARSDGLARVLTGWRAFLRVGARFYGLARVL